jgi:uncharacterized protein (TIGR02284 family)
MENYKELTNDLNKILARNYDAINGYKNAADNIKNKALKAFFEDQVLERLKFSQELEYEIQMYGQEVVGSGSMEASLHRAWMDLKTALSKNNDEAVVEECIRGEEAACQDYQDIINNGLPTHGSLYNILKSHKRQIEKSIFHLKSIESIVS